MGETATFASSLSTLNFVWRPLLCRRTLGEVVTGTSQPNHEAPLRVRSVYFTARFLAQTSQNVLLAGLFLTAGTSSTAAIDLSSVFVAILLGAVILGPVGGAFVDRVGAGRGFVTGASLRTLVALGGLLFLFDGGSPWLIAFAYSAVSQIYTPSEMALVRSLDRHHAGRAHSLLVGLQYAGQGAGMLVLAPLLYLVAGKPALFAGATAGFSAVVVLSAVVAISMRDRHVRPLATRDAFTYRETIAFFRVEPRAKYAIVVMAFKTMVSRVVFVALPLYLVHDMGLSESVIAYLLVPGCVGVLVSLAWSSRSLSVERAHEVMRFSFYGMIAAVFALAALDYGVTAFAQYTHVPPIVRLEASLNTTFVVAMPVAFLLGMALTGALVASRVVITELAPHAQQARVFAAQETLSEVLVVAPLLLAGFGTHYAGARPVLAVVGAIGVLAIIVLDLLPRYEEVVIQPAPPPEERYLFS